MYLVVQEFKVEFYITSQAPGEVLPNMSLNCWRNSCPSVNNGHLRIRGRVELWLSVTNLELLGTWHVSYIRVCVATQHSFTLQSASHSRLLAWKSKSSKIGHFQNDIKDAIIKSGESYGDR